MSDLIIAGPVGIRPMHLDRACQQNVGHEHNYDHTTIVIRGRVKVLYSYMRDGQLIEGESEEYAAGETIEIRAKVRHTIIALENDTLYFCVFSHRDFNGVVCERYEAAMGNQEAYR